MGRSSDQVLFSILRARALVPEDRLKEALTTAQREEIPLERVLLREGLLKASACEHVLQSRALRARSCQRCGEFTYLLDEQGVISTPCERCGGSLQPSPADGPRLSSTPPAGPARSGAGGRDPNPTRKAPSAAAALREKKEASRPTGAKEGVMAIADLARPTRRPGAANAGVGSSGAGEVKERPAASATRSRPAPPPMRPAPRPRAAPGAPPKTGSVPAATAWAPDERSKEPGASGSGPARSRPEVEAARSEVSRRMAASAAGQEPLDKLLQPILEDAGQRLHARLALELRAHLAAELDGLAHRATESAIGQAEKRLQAETRKLVEQLQQDAEAAVSRAAATTAAPGEGNLSAWSALLAERARAAVLAGDLPPAWEERARSAAEAAAREVAAQAEAGAPEGAALEQLTARVLESIWAHLETTGLEGFPARVVEGIHERARDAVAGAGASAEPVDPDQLTARVLESIWAHLEQEGAGGFPARVGDELVERARGAAREDQAELAQRLEQVATEQRESHVLGAEEMTGFGARLAALERRLGVDAPAGGAPGEDPLELLAERLAALERRVAAGDGATRLSPESLDQAVQVALDAVEERLRSRYDELVADLEARISARAEEASESAAAPLAGGPSGEELEQRIASAVERAIDSQELANKVAMLATAPVMHAIDQRISQVDEEVVKRITRQVYSEMRKMAEERRSGKFLRQGQAGDGKDDHEAAEPQPADTASN